MKDAVVAVGTDVMFGKMTAVRCVHPLNTFPLIFVTAAGNLSFVSAVQLWKVKPPIWVSPVKVTLVSEVQPLKKYCEVVLSDGRLTVVSPVHSLKTPCCAVP